MSLYDNLAPLGGIRFNFCMLSLMGGGLKGLHASSVEIISPP
jgi:hypothetical protein